MIVAIASFEGFSVQGGGSSEAGCERAPRLCRLLGAKLLYEYVARRLGGGPVPEFWSRMVGAAMGFAFASTLLDCHLLDCLPKTVVPWSMGYVKNL